MNVLRIIGIALVTIGIQWLLIQDLPLTEFGNPYIYLWAFFIIPFRTSKATTYIIAFVIGSILDSLEQSGGSHTIACLLTVAAKPSVENFLYGFKEENSTDTLSSLTLAKFLPVVSIIVLVHHGVLFSVENSGFSQFSALGLRILVSTLSTVGLLTIIHLLLSKRYAA
jgi:hypothetical protein